MADLNVIGTTVGELLKSKNDLGVSKHGAFQAAELARRATSDAQIAERHTAIDSDLAAKIAAFDVSRTAKNSAYDAYVIQIQDAVNSTDNVVSLEEIQVQLGTDVEEFACMSAAAQVQADDKLADMYARLGVLDSSIDNYSVSL